MDFNFTSSSSLSQSDSSFCFWLNSELISRLVSHSQTARNGLESIGYFLTVGGSSKQIDHGKYSTGGLELFMVHYTQRTWAMNYVNGCRTHMIAGQGEFSKKKKGVLIILFLSQQIHTYSLRLMPSFENHFCYSARKDEKQALWKTKASFRILFSDTLSVCMRSASSLEEVPVLWSLKEDFEYLKMLSELWLWSCITKMQNIPHPW